MNTIGVTPKTAANDAEAWFLGWVSEGGYTHLWLGHPPDDWLAALRSLRRTAVARERARLVVGVGGLMPAHLRSGSLYRFPDGSAIALHVSVPDRYVRSDILRPPGYNQHVVVDRPEILRAVLSEDGSTDWMNTMVLIEYWVQVHGSLPTLPPECLSAALENANRQVRLAAIAALQGSDAAEVGEDRDTQAALDEAAAEIDRGEGASLSAAEARLRRRLHE